MTLSISDLAQTLILRRAISDTRSSVNASIEDLSAGQASDPSRHLRGHTASLAALTSTLARNKAIDEGLTLARTRADVMQAALSNIEKSASDTAYALLSTSAAVTVPGVQAVGRQSIAALTSVLSALNQRSLGQSLFAGTATQGPALVPVEDFLSAASTATATATSPAELSSMLDDWFARSDGFSAQVALGDGAPMTVLADNGNTISHAITARSHELVQTLKGLIMGSLLTENRFSDDQAGQGELARLAGQTLYAGAASRSDLVAQLGLAQARMDDAAARLSEETTTLQAARNDLLSVDMYELTAKLTEQQARLEALYTLTSRLSGLSLTGYLR